MNLELNHGKDIVLIEKVMSTNWGRIGLEITQVVLVFIMMIKGGADEYKIHSLARSVKPHSRKRVDLILNVLQSFTKINVHGGRMNEMQMQVVVTVPLFISEEDNI